MSKGKTLFSTLPNEIICCIFEFLTTSDILRAFVQLNHRYRDVVRYYVKHIDLTDDWQIYRSELQYICQSVESVKVDQYGLDLFMNYQFPQLHSLILIRIADWKKLLHHMNLQNLKLWFQSDHINGSHCFLNSGSHLLTLKQFSSNDFFNTMRVHKNLTHLNVHVTGIYHLLGILQYTPTVQHVSVHFDRAFDVWGKDNDEDKKDFEAFTIAFPRLCNLNSIAFTTMNENDPRTSKCNERFPFYQFQLFIDNCCPNKTILKKITLQLLNISFDEYVWSVIQQYKNTFDSFNVYISFGTTDNLEQLKNKFLSSNKFVYHLEDQFCDTEINYSLIHLYTLPFIFTKLYGFTYYSNIDQQCSYSTVRHLYFRQHAIDDNHTLSFQSLEKQMLNLVSVDCGLVYNHECANNSLENYSDMLYSVRTLYYKVTCKNSDCIYYNQFCPTVGRMPNLKILTSSIHTFNQLNHPLMFLKKLHLHDCKYIDLDKLAALVPNLSILLLSDLPSNSNQVSLWVYSLFVRFSQLIILSLEMSYNYCNHGMTDKPVPVEILAMVQNMDSKFQHLKLTFDYGRMVFSFPNL